MGLLLNRSTTERDDRTQPLSGGPFESIASLALLVFNADCSVIEIGGQPRPDGANSVVQPSTSFALAGSAHLGRSDFADGVPSADPVRAQDLGFAAYAAVPLRTRAGVPVGRIAVLGSAPRDFDARDCEILQGFALVIGETIEGVSAVV